MASPVFLLSNGVNSRSSARDAAESRARFAEFEAECVERFRPATTEERAQVDRMIRTGWLLRRLSRAEAQIRGYYAAQEARDGAAATHRLPNITTSLTRLARRIRFTECAYSEARQELDRLQAGRLGETHKG